MQKAGDANWRAHTRFQVYSNISLFLMLSYLLGCLIYTSNAITTDGPEMPWALYCYYKWWGNGIGGDCLIYIKMWVGRQAVSITLDFLFCFFFSSVFVVCYLTFSVPLFRWLEHDGCCAFYVFPFFLLSLVRF